MEPVCIWKSSLSAEKLIKLVSMSFNYQEMEFLRLLCTSEHKQLGQDTLRDRLVEMEVIEPDDFKSLKKKLLYSGIIGIVYGNITIQDKSILSLFKDDETAS